MTIQIAGSSNAGPLEVEQNQLAARFTMRPNDFGLRGSYCSGGSYVYMLSVLAQGPGSGPTLAAFRWSDDTAVAVIRKISVSMGYIQGSGGTITNGQVIMQLNRIFNFTQQFISFRGTGTGVSTAPQQMGFQKAVPMRATMPNSAADFIIPADSASGQDTWLGNPAAGTTILIEPAAFEGDPLSSVFGGFFLTNSFMYIPPVALFDARVNEQPLVLDAACGFGVSLSGAQPTPATTALSARFSISAAWDEYELRAYA